MTALPAHSDVDINSFRMPRAVPLLALATFALGTETYVYTGHLAALAADLGAPVAAAGQLATAFALTYAVSAPVVAGLVARFDRRAVLVYGLLALAVLNLAAVFASSLPTLIALRIACGLAAGAVGPIASAAAAELAPPHLRGRAMALVLGGMTLAFVLGIPMGSVVGEIAGWRGTFLWAAVLALAAALALRAGLPTLPGSPRAQPPLGAVLRGPVLGWLALTSLGFAATFTVIAYVGPVVTAIAGLTGSGVGAMQALIGAGSLIGIWAGGRAADRADPRRALVASLLVSAAALGGYGVLLTGVLPPALALAPLAALMVAGAAALFARTPVIQTALVRLAPGAHPVVLGLNGSAVFAGQSLGAALGGAALAAGGLPALGLAAALVALAALPLALRLTVPASTPAAHAAPTQETLP
jgi:DHA1 family inner membrane transport protein